ncbi:flavin reductase family protein [Oceanicella actignis]|uniref:flavin reductase family protein n=1 Tax=Oceanicella actignis TaxID=1189325 RepID=UPI0011E8431D|nr:flavin reductase family protein [Oceanicella actignis]TYO90752.1 flavin reductase (DIM6/NTAB) family NADH-FMN oxidoreductase RutF [Oceanicella actignis]
MRYRPADGHGLPHDPFKAIVAPRPIGWISTVDEEGRANLAPYSFFNAVADRPPVVMYSTTGRKLGLDERKDSLANIRRTGEFVVNLTSWDLREQMNATSAHLPHGEDEFLAAGLEKAPSVEVAPPRVAAAPAALECRLLQEVALPCWDETGENVVVFGEVVHIHIRDDMIVDGRFDLTRSRPLARCGYQDYAVIERLFQMRRPGQGGGR